MTGGSAAASKPCFEFVKVQPERVIKHAVDFQGPFDENAVTTPLRGPYLFGHPVHIDSQPPAVADAFLNVYEIHNPPPAERRILSLRDPEPDAVARQITIGQAAYVLLPTQQITTGPPSPLDESLSRFKAYRILQEKPARKELRVQGSYGKTEIMWGEPAWLCVPVEEWHHAEHFPVKDARHWMVIYAVSPQPHSQAVNTIDSFGMHSLASTDVAWLALPVEPVAPTTDRRK